MSPFQADAALFYCSVIWGSTFFLVKGALDAVDPVSMVAWRFLLAALLLAPWVGPKPRKAAHIKEAAILALLLTALYVSQTAGMLWTSAANSGFITGLFIAFVPVFLVVFLRQRPDVWQWAAVAVALAGLWLLTGGPRDFNYGDALTLIAAATYAGHLLATDRYVRKDADVVLLAFHQFWMTGLLALGLAALLGRPLAVGTPGAWGVIVFLTVFPTLSGFYLQMLAQKVTHPVKVSLIFSLEPVFAAVFAWTAGGETFIPARALGGGLIVLAMMVGELGKLPFLKGRKKEILPV